MVQRKVPNKLGIQADHVKTEKLLGNQKPAPSCQHQDGKNRSSDMKKKMKRSRSIKLSDIDSLKSSPLRKTISQPGKPPPFNAPTTAASLQKHPTRKEENGSPNYMKSTSCSEARKGRSPVSSLNSLTGSDIKNLHQRNSSIFKDTSASSHKPTKSLKKPSSLKLVRTLTRTPSFKPVRGTTKKNTRVALCADVNVQRATCSSTLKDSKYPEYLMLKPGGTEAEGTSSIKVCPYTYCSLNGHHHAPLPPLKCFLKARQRSLKTQKSIKLEILSPCRAKQSCLLHFSEDKSPSKEMDSVDSVKIPIIQEVGADFFIEIYAQDTAEAKKVSTKKNDAETNPLTGEPVDLNKGSWFCGGNEVKVEPNINKEALENLSAKSAPTVIYFVESFQGYSDASSVDMDVTGDSTQNQKLEDTYAEDIPILSWEFEASLYQDEGFLHGSDFEEDDKSTSESADAGSLEEQFSGSEINAKDDNLNIPEDKIEQLSETMTFDFQGKAELTGSDEVVSNYAEEIPADQAASSDAIEELTDMEERDTTSDTNSVCGLASAASSWAPSLESTAWAEDVHEDADGHVGNEVWRTSHYVEALEDCITDMIAGAWDDYQDRASAETDEETKWIQNLTDDSGQTCNEIAGDEADEDYNKDQPAREKEMVQNLGTGGSLEQEISILEAGDTIEDQDQLAYGGIPYQGWISNQFASICDSDLDYPGERNNHNCLAAKSHEYDGDAKDSSSSHDLAEDCGLAGHCNHQLENQNDCTDFIGNQNAMEEDQIGATKIRIPTSTEPEEHGDINTLMKSAGNDTEDVENMEEDCSKSVTAETFLHSEKDTSAGSERKFLRKGSNPNLGIPSARNNGRWTISHKNPAMKMDDKRKFNPREPNFLPVVPDPEAEKVDLKHQWMDDRKNAEEWMLDFALQQAVTKLAPARKRKVALLVEAFEAVLPIPKYDTHISHPSTAFSPRPIQACS